MIFSTLIVRGSSDAASGYQSICRSLSVNKARAVITGKCPAVVHKSSYLKTISNRKITLCCLVHAIHYGRSPAYLTETVQSVGASRSRSGLLYLYLIFHLVDKLLSTTAAHEVRRAGVLTCGSGHLERSARPHPQWLILSSSENC